MKITKYPQSCVLIELKDKKILIDPGDYVYQKTDMKPENWTGIDLILLTHEHSDHYEPDSLKIIMNTNPGAKIITNTAVSKLLEKERLSCQTVEPGEYINLENIEIKGIKSQHGPLPSGDPPPEVISFLIDRRILHMGDTIKSDQVPAEVVFIPMCGDVCFSPKDAVKYLKKVKPQLVIPIHYDNEKFITDTNVFAEALEKGGFEYKILKDKETVEV